VRAGIVLRPTIPQLEPRRLFAAVPERPYRTPQADAMVDLLVAAGSAWPSRPAREAAPVT
jgi:hypothetical protein